MILVISRWLFRLPFPGRKPAGTAWVRKEYLSDSPWYGSQRNCFSLDLNPCISSATAVELFVVQVHWNSSSWKICFQNFPEFWKGAAEEVQGMFLFVAWLIGWLGFWGFLCFSKFYRLISLCMEDVPGSVFLLHLLLWAGPGTSPMQRALGWLLLFASPGPGELEAAQVGTDAQSLSDSPNPQHPLGKENGRKQGRRW